MLFSLELLELLSSFIVSYIWTTLIFLRRYIRGNGRPHLLLLPPEILLEISQYLDYRALIEARQTCRTLYGMMNSEQFWAGLARNLSCKPGIGEMTYPLGNYSTTELMHWTLRRLRARDRWVFDDPSKPLQFRSRLINGGGGFYGAELLRGGRWLFTLQDDGAAHILDLEKQFPEPQFLFKTYRSKEEPLVKFRIWVDETKRELSFRVATHGWEAHRKRRTRICIYQVDFAVQDSSWEATRISVIRDYPRTGLRSWVALSENFFLQSFGLRDSEGQIIGPGTTIVLQLRRYSRALPCCATQYVEERIQSNGPTSVFFLPGDRAGFAGPTFMNIYAINSDPDSTLPRLSLLHHVPVSQAANLLSAPFVGSQCTYLLGTFQNAFRKITIGHDLSSPPVILDIGEMKPVTKQVSSVARFGPSASLISRSRTSLEIIIHESCAPGPYFQRRRYDPPNEPELQIKHLTAFDDSIGRIVMETIAAEGGRLMILDLI